MGVTETDWDPFTPVSHSSKCSYITPALPSSPPDYLPAPPSRLSPSSALPCTKKFALSAAGQSPSTGKCLRPYCLPVPHRVLFSRAYCSDECENLDVTSPSISTTSSAHPSPFLRSSANVPPNLSEVPALLPSALGRSLDVCHPRVRASESSSSASSASWSVVDDEYDEQGVSPGLYGPSTDDEYYYAVHPDYNAVEGKPASAPGLRSASSLTYARRPSTTNHRSTIPALHRRTSSVSTPNTGLSPGISQECFTEDDMSDVPSTTDASSSVPSSRRQSRHLGDLNSVAPEEEDREKEDTMTGKKRRNRASLPAYFSLLVSTTTSPRSQKTPSALSMLSRSLHSSGSPPTPRIANPVVDTTTAFAVAQPARISKAHNSESAPRGRSRRRDPDARSSSSRRSPSRSPRLRAHVHQSAHARARLDSMEKVADWVAHSPVVAAGVRAALAQRRNSSPPPLPKFEKLDLHDSSAKFDSGYAIDDFDQEPEPTEGRRGRRRMNELDTIPYGADPKAPGYGNGRSGLVSRERGRAVVARR